MTKEEAIDVFEGVLELDGISMFYQPGGKAGSLTIRGIKEASRIAISAIRAQQAKLDRSLWEGCPVCITNECETCKYTYCRKREYPCCDCSRNKKYEPDGFCPVCGRPLTEEAWAELERRINGGAS